MHLYCLIINFKKQIQLNLYICNARWYADRVFKNNSTHVLTFYQSELDRKHAIHVFFESFVK